MGLKTATAGMLIAAFALAAPAHLQAQEPVEPVASTSIDKALKYATELHLAYVTNPSQQTNNESRLGVEALAAELFKRTKIEPEGVVGLDIENDEIAFFPFIYWPITSDSQPLSAKAQKKVIDYMNNGGMILFDIRDRSSITLGNSTALRRVLGEDGAKAIKPLVPMGKDHTLTKSFYLVSTLPGSHDFATVWIETPESEGSKENVSSVIIGENNWSGAWAGRTLLPDSREREMALRAGVNMVMYAMAGNYKSDQVHVPMILERLGRD